MQTMSQTIKAPALLQLYPLSPENFAFVAIAVILPTPTSTSLSPFTRDHEFFVFKSGFTFDGTDSMGPKEARSSSKIGYGGDEKMSG